MSEERRKQIEEAAQSSFDKLKSERGLGGSVGFQEIFEAGATWSDLNPIPNHPVGSIIVDRNRKLEHDHALMKEALEKIGADRVVLISGEATENLTWTAGLASKALKKLKVKND